MPGLSPSGVMAAIAPAGALVMEEGRRFQDADVSGLGQGLTPFSWLNASIIPEAEDEGSHDSPLTPFTGRSGCPLPDSSFAIQSRCAVMSIKGKGSDNALGLMRRSFTCNLLPMDEEVIVPARDESLESESTERAFHMNLVQDQLHPCGQSASAWPVVRSGHGSDKGPRKHMEDAHVIVDDLTKSFADLSFSHQGSFYGVFDGHGGGAAAKFVSNQLLGNILSDPSFPDQVVEAIHNAFMRTDRELETAHSSVSEPMESGTTALAVLLLGRALYVANAGDCRAVLCRRGKVVELSRDHRPSCQIERERIQLAGGFVVDDYLNDQLAVTRALGDWHLQGLKSRATNGETVMGPLIAEPEVQEAELTEEDEFLVIACDGLWDAFRHSHEVVSFARRRLRFHNNPEQCSQELVQEAIRRDSCDNVTVVTVCFSAQPPPPLQHQEFRNSRLRRSFSANELQSS